MKGIFSTFSVIHKDGDGGDRFHGWWVNDG